MILVDSSVWIDYFRGTITAQTEKLDRLLGSELLATGDLMLTEVLQGFDGNQDFLRAKKLLMALIAIEIGGEWVAIQAAQNFRTLRRRGVTVRKTIDSLIATRCIEDGHQLLHSDKDFEPFAEHLGLGVA